MEELQNTPACDNGNNSVVTDSLIETVSVSSLATNQIDDNNTSSKTVKENLLDTNALLRKDSEKFYMSIVGSIVTSSQENLKDLRNDKEELRLRFVSFFETIIYAQLMFMFILIAGKTVFELNLSDSALIVYMSTVFVETLGCVVLMIKFAFKSQEEVEIIGTLNTVVKTFQKFKK